MAFLFKKIIVGKRKRSTKASREILDKLEQYLLKNVDEPVEFLVGFWKDQSDAITYKEIRQAILDGYMSKETLQMWQQDYSILVKEKMQSLWQQSLSAGSVSQPIMDKVAETFSFNTNTASIKSWIKERGAEFVTSATIEQKEAIKSLLSEYVNGTYTVDELSRVIRPCVGLTKSQAQANLKYYNNIKESLKKDHPKMKAESIKAKAKEAATKYAERQHRQRAMDIAQTEMAFAYNRGADEGIRQAQSENFMGVVEKRWSTSGDGSVCEICAGLDGTQIEMDDDFEFNGRLLFAGQRLTPPAHPRCACAVQYIEISPPIFKE